MSIKLLISGESNSGKTTLTKTLKDAFIVSHDGKRYVFPVPHMTVSTFDSVADLIQSINQKIVAYKEKYGSYPKTVVFDSASKIFDTILNNCNRKFTGFKIYSELNSEIAVFTAYIENTLIASNMNVVIISHALYDQDTAKYTLVGKGDFGKRGEIDRLAA